MTESFEQRVQRLAEEHLSACNEALYDDEGTISGEIVGRDSPAIGPYCGCDTCIVREVLWVTWEAFMAESGRVRIR